MSELTQAEEDEEGPEAVNDLIQMPLGNGGILLIRAASRDNDSGTSLEGTGPVQAGRNPLESLSERMLIAQGTLERALEPISKASKAILSALEGASPDEVSVEFGVELTAEANAVMARMGGDCHMSISLTWNRKDEPKGLGQTAEGSLQ